MPKLCLSSWCLNVRTRIWFFSNFDIESIVIASCCVYYDMNHNPLSSWFLHIYREKKSHLCIPTNFFSQKNRWIYIFVLWIFRGPSINNEKKSRKLPCAHNACSHHYTILSSLGRLPCYCLYMFNEIVITAHTGYTPRARWWSYVVHTHMPKDAHRWTFFAIIPKNVPSLYFHKSP